MKRILALDLGGTFTRVGGFESPEPARLTPLFECRFETARGNSLESLADCWMEREPGLNPDNYDIFVAAVPGPVEKDGTAKLASLSWNADISPLAKRFPSLRIEMINDFIAQGYACVSPNIKEQAQCIKPGGELSGPLAVVGAGTGLGCCTMISHGKHEYLSVSSEFAHSMFPFVNDEEDDFRRFLADAEGLSHVVNQDIVSGAGLSRIHYYLTGELKSPGQISKGLLPDSPTAQMFSRFYARICRNYALTVLPSTLFISGGVAVKNPFLVDCDAFRKEFVDSASKAGLLKQMAVYLNSMPGTGLFGAGFYGSFLV